MRGASTYKHTQHSLLGLVEIHDATEVDAQTTTVLVPKRKKHYLVTTYSSYDWATEVNKQMDIRLPLMEADYADARQLYIFNCIQKEISKEPQSRAFVSLVMNTGRHAHLAILSQWRDVYLYGVYDTVNKSVRLVWTDDEWFISDVRAYDYTRYVFYRFPVIQDRPLFMYSQSLCSKWRGWTEQFKGPDGILKAMNSLELFLFKEPELPSLKVEDGSSR